MSRRTLLGLVLTFMAGSAAAFAQDLRADTPLWTYDDSGEELFPANFSDGESFGCSNIISTGVYRFEVQDDPDATAFWRIANYGLFTAP